ncbi:MAG: leucyl/phenylalanyl-tRNA--protein transferase [Dehalococcoidia bacterium]
MAETGGRGWQIPIEVETAGPPTPLPPSPWEFPLAESTPGDGPLAIGGDFEPATVIAAYRAGAFPWPHDSEEYLWFSPDPRAILPLDRFHVPRRLARTIRQGRFRVSVDDAFDAVMGGCASAHGESWITPALKAGYTELHRLGWAHSFEVRDPAGRLAGGLYGVAVGRLFGAESMFHSVRDASKVAVAAMVQHARALGVELVDLQVINPHTASIGALEIPRTRYLALARRAMADALDWSVLRSSGEAGN